MLLMALPNVHAHSFSQVNPFYRYTINIRKPFYKKFTLTIGDKCETTFNPCFTSQGAPICQNSGICTPNFGVSPFYQCQCKSGFGGQTCQDVLTTQAFTLASTTTQDPANCVDTDAATCEYYASNNLCSNLYIINNVPVVTYCPKSCKTCGTGAETPTCVDSQSSCDFWGSSGNCNKLPDPTICRKSCGLC